MSTQFAFAFTGDDIDETTPSVEPIQQTAPASAFPVEGKPQLPPLRHDLGYMLSQLPSKVAFGLLHVTLDDGQTVDLPRRELWDVRVQLMAEDDGDEVNGTAAGLGKHDVKTGVYEGGFKSWESSVDLVKVLAGGAYSIASRDRAVRVIELGCGTALPSLAVFRCALASPTPGPGKPLSMILADYNPTVLRLVTLPNFILAWALREKDQMPAVRDAFALEGELELTDEVKAAFQSSLSSLDVSLVFVSGGWSGEFVNLLYDTEVLGNQPGTAATMILGAETIYSPFSLKTFHETVFDILKREQRVGAESRARALVAAKRMYFGVGGSLDDFVAKAQESGAIVRQLREEVDGVRRGVVECELQASGES